MLENAERIGFSTILLLVVQGSPSSKIICIQAYGETLEGYLVTNQG